MTVAVKNEIEVVGRERLTPALDVAKKFIAKSESRPALKHVAIMPKGEIHATDSHTAIILKNIHSYKEQLLLNPKTLELVKGYNFPNLNNIMEIHEPKLHAIIIFKRNRIEELLQAFKFFKSNKYDSTKIEFRQDEVKISEYVHSLVVRNDECWEHTPCNENEYSAVTFNSDYWVLALESFLKFSDLEEITAYYHGPLRPFIFDNEDMKIAILPKRTY